MGVRWLEPEALVNALLPLAMLTAGALFCSAERAAVVLVVLVVLAVHEAELAVHEAELVPAFGFVVVAPVVGYQKLDSRNC